ncbi:MAG: glycosyltransferase [Bacteroidetes bacterium]|nr:glycosyltransferase [Bacteroidota bacterium]
MTDKPVVLMPEDIQRIMGKDAQRNNIMAARMVSEIVKTTLGPKGMDKMLVSPTNDIIITNDGVTILEEMQIEHPAAKMMVEIAKTQENEVGDGTTTVVMLAGKLLENAEKLLDKKIHPTVITKGYRLAAEKSQEILNEIALRITPNDEEILKQIAMTAMTGKGAEDSKEKFAEIIVSAVKQISDFHSSSEAAEEGHLKKSLKIDLDDIKIEKSKGDLIVTTDADCFYSENWLRSLLSNFDAETGFISGPVEFIEEENLFSRIQKLEFASLILTGAGLIGAGRPIICNGANIAYRKKVFDEVGGFKDQINLSSGDDELLMQKIAAETKYKIRFSLNRDSIVKTKSNSGINNFYQQRKRWASKGLFYKNTNLIVMLLLIFLFYFGLIIHPFLILFLSTSFLFILLLSVIIKLLLEYLIIRKGKKMLFPKLSLKEFILAEILQVPYIIVAGFAGMFGNLKWKGREIKR